MMHQILVVVLFGVDNVGPVHQLLGVTYVASFFFWFSPRETLQNAHVLMWAVYTGPQYDVG